jgi:hypothetical protein
VAGGACVRAPLHATAMAAMLLAAAAGLAFAALPAEQCGGEPVNASDVPYKTPGAPATFTFPAVPAPRLVPFPASLQADAAWLPLAGCTIHVGGTAAEQKQLLPLAQLLSTEVAAATDGAVRLPVVASSSAASSALPIILLSLSESAAAGGTAGGTDEAYSLSVTSESASLAATSYAGMVAATATLLQAVEHSFDVDAVPRTKANCTTNPVWRLPAITVRDQPALPYRGIMVDAARAYLPLSALKGFVTMCRLYKLNYIHIHLTDDGAFSFPSTAYPELAQQSPWKYNLTDLHELQAFAEVRGVYIIGEMDVPGHAASMVRSLPHVFGFGSIGIQAQVGIVDFTNKSVVHALQTIFSEINAVFPSPYVHMGGDEVSFGKIAKLPEIAAALKRENLSEPTDLYRLFIDNMQRYAKAQGKILQVWEGFRSDVPGEGGPGTPASPVPVSQEVVVSPFDCNIYAPPLLAKGGYSIINSAWTPLYIAGHGRDGAHHPLPPELVFRWNPWLFGSVIHSLEWWRIPKEHAEAVIGAQMCVWQMSAKDHLCMLSSRAPAMAERVWNPHGGHSFADYTVRVQATGQLLYKLLEAQGSLPAVPSSPPGPPPSPGPGALAGYSAAHGGCRDAHGMGSQYLFWDARINPGRTHIPLANCSAMCAKLGASRCDAYDYSGAWCGIWGTTLTVADVNETDDGRWELSKPLGGDSCADKCKVCHADLSGARGNTCYLRGGVTCGGASPSPPPPGPADNSNAQPGCLESCGGCV